MQAPSLTLRSSLFRPGQRIAVAVSGGADSVALLRRLLEERHALGIVLSVVHVHHGIREAAEVAASVAQPRTDHRGSAEYKRHLVRVFVSRILGGTVASTGATAERAA